MTGRFITFEGGEGCGKTTQSRMLAAHLRGMGHEVVTTREPGGTAGAEIIRNLLLTNEGDGWNPRAEALLFAAARSDHVEKLIRPTVEREGWVVCDRYLDSSRAYQGGGGGLSEEDLLDLHRIGSEGFLPDMTILLEVPPDEVARRLELRDAGVNDRIGGRDPEYHAKVADAFRSFADREPQRFLRIDAVGDAETIHARILAEVTKSFCAVAGLQPAHP